MAIPARLMGAFRHSLTDSGSVNEEEHLARYVIVGEQNSDAKRLDLIPEDAKSDNLLHFIRGRAALTPLETLNVGKQLLAGLGILAKQHIFPRLTLQNVLVTRRSDGSLVLKIHYLANEAEKQQQAVLHLLHKAHGEIVRTQGMVAAMHAAAVSQIGEVVGE